MIFDINPFDRYLKIGIFCQIYFTWFVLKKNKIPFVLFLFWMFSMLKIGVKIVDESNIWNVE